MEDHHSDSPPRFARPADGPRPQLSVTIPVYNEEGNLDVLYQRLTAVLGAYGKTYELQFVDDGSTDASFEKLKALCERDPAVRVVRFARNFGQQMAHAAGFQYARGDVIVMMDADLQVAPEDIPKLVDKLLEGYDIVYGIRTNRVDSAFRRFGSWVVGRILAWITGVKTPDNASGFQALDRRFVDSLNLFNDKSKYLSGLIAWLSYGRWAAVPVSHAARHAGATKYTLRKLMALTFNLICNFTALPLRMAFYAGWIVSVFGAVALLGSAGLYLWGAPGPHGSGRVMFFLALILSGLQLTAAGILGEYIGRIYHEVRQQPHYVVREVLEHPPIADFRHSGS